MSGRINGLRFRLREPPGPCSICSFSSEPSAELLGSTPPFRICRVCVEENLPHVDPSADVAALEPKHDDEPYPQRLAYLMHFRIVGSSCSASAVLGFSITHTTAGASSLHDRESWYR